MENILIRWLTGLAIAAALFLYGAGYLSPRSQAYAVSPATAHALLARTPLPPVVLGDRDGHDIPNFSTKSPLPITVKTELLPEAQDDTVERDYTIDATDPARIIWTFKKHGVPMLDFVATLVPSGATATRITVDVTAPSNAANGEIARRLKDNSTIKNLYVTAMKEQIAAVLEKRDFNLTSIYPAMMAATAANFSELNSRFNRAIEADQKRVERNIERAYAKEAGRE